MTAGEREAFREGTEEGYVQAVDWFERKLTGASAFQIVEVHGIFGQDVRFADVAAEALAAFRRVEPARRKTTVTGRRAKKIRKMNVKGMA